MFGDGGGDGIDRARFILRESQAGNQGLQLVPFPLLSWKWQPLADQPAMYAMVVFPRKNSTA